MGVGTLRFQTPAESRAIDLLSFSEPSRWHMVHRNIDSKWGSHRRCGGEPGTSANVSTVLFACIHNRRELADGGVFFNALADPTKAHAISAGTEPAEFVHPEVVDTMREVAWT